MDSGGATMKTSLFLTGATMIALSLSAQAQTRPNIRAAATLPLPEGVKRVVSIDAYNVLLAETERDGARGFAGIELRHGYSGGYARLFGGTIISTAEFISPIQPNRAANTVNNPNNTNNAVLPVQQGN
jgi:hypothetical protein